MTECERIIQQGVLPESFFREEERCGFLVTEKRKKIWAIELDIYLKFAEVCNKYNLKFWGDGGTLLGAVRHNGFIPWDDDMDVIMPRKDYNVLMEVGEREFSAPYFFQTPYTDSNYGYSFAKLRNTNTTCMPKVFAKAGFNHGIHIDIIPLDNISIVDGELNYKRIRELNYDNSTYMRMNNPCLSEKDKERIRNFSGRIPKDTYEEIHKIASLHEKESTEYVGTMVITVLDFSRKLLSAKAFKKTKYRKFEGYDIPIPIGYDCVLNTEFGNYMELPSIEERGNWHTGVYFDADHAYMDYLNQFPE